MKTNVQFWSNDAEFLWEWEVFTQNCRENQNFFTVTFSENTAVDEITWENIVQLDSTQITI